MHRGSDRQVCWTETLAGVQDNGAHYAPRKRDLGKRLSPCQPKRARHRIFSKAERQQGTRLAWEEERGYEWIAQPLETSMAVCRPHAQPDSQ